MSRISGRMITSILYRRRLVKGLEEMEAKLEFTLQESSSKRICFDNYTAYLVDGQIVIKQIPGMDKYQLRIKEFIKETV